MENKKLDMDSFGEIMDKFILENEVGMSIIMPEGTIEPEIQEDTARFVMSGDSIVVDFDNFWSYEVEVMGNIHDNTEILCGDIDE